MHSEHLRNVQISWVAFGWFIGLAVAATVLLLLAGAGFSHWGGLAEMIALALAMALGWFVGGFIVGFKAAAAPVLHGAAMARFTFVAWFALNLVFGGMTTGISAWEYFGGRSLAAGLLVQVLAAIAGCWVGYRYTPVRVD
ncbi:MAG: hypothetical protein N2B05_02810 [Gemmatimonadales bacterium]